MDPSVRALVADLCGEDVLASGESTQQAMRPAPRRLPVAQAVARCSASRVVPALLEGQEVALCFLADGSTVTVPDQCPHDGGLLSDGFMEGDTLVCGRHGWEFDARTGQCSHRSGLCIPTQVASAGLAEGSGPVDS